MPDLSTFYKIKMAGRGFPQVYGPIRKVYNFFVRTIPWKLIDILRSIASERMVRLGPPRGHFSIYTSPTGWGPRPGRIVLYDQGVLDVPPESLLVRSKMDQHCSQPWPVFWSRHQRARLVGTSLALLDNKKRLCSESAYGDYVVRDDPSWNYAWLPKEFFLPGKWTSVVSRWSPNNQVAPFSHWVLDSLPRLALLSEFPPDTGILVPGKLAGYQKETLKMLGLLDRVRCTPESNVIVEDYYFSAPTVMISTYNPYGIDFLRSAYLPLADKSYRGPRRFVIQRKGKTRGILNNDEVNDFFKALGWEIINTEDLTFAQEIELFKNAEAFAGVMGSGFTNAVWSSPGCKVVMMVPDNLLDGWAEWICILNKLKFHWKLFPSDHETMIRVDLNELKILLAEAGVETK
jgi:glycosyl transferase family 61